MLQSSCDFLSLSLGMQYCWATSWRGSAFIIWWSLSSHLLATFFILFMITVVKRYLWIFLFLTNNCSYTTFLNYFLWDVLMVFAYVFVPPSKCNLSFRIVSENTLVIFYSYCVPLYLCFSLFSDQRHIWLQSFVFLWYHTCFYIRNSR